MRRIARTGKSKNNDEIQGSFTPFRMTVETLDMTVETLRMTVETLRMAAENKELQKALRDEFLNRF
jgi:hypothetical protein